MKTSKDAAESAKVKQYKDYRPETRALLEALVKAGFAIDSIDDGGGLIRPRTIDTAVDAICAVDGADLYATHPTNGKLFWLQIVLGNSPGELVCDHTYRSPLTEVVDTVSDAWDGKPQPMVTEGQS